MNGTTTTTTHDHLGERLDALLEHELDPADEAAARAHLAGCPDCRRDHDRLRGAMTLAGALGTARAPDGLATRILKRVRSERRSNLFRTSVEQKVPYEGAIIVILAAALAALVLAYAAAHTDGLFAKKQQVESVGRP